MRCRLNRRIRLLPIMAAVLALVCSGDVGADSTEPSKHPSRWRFEVGWGLSATLAIDDFLGFYSTDPEPTFSGTFRVADGRWTAYRLEVVFSERDRKLGRFGGFLGLAWNHLDSLDVTEQAIEDYPLSSVSTEDGTSLQLGGEWLARINRKSRWSLGLSSSLTVGTGAEVRFQTDPLSRFESGTIFFLPWTITLRAGWNPASPRP